MAEACETIDCGCISSFMISLSCLIVTQLQDWNNFVLGSKLCLTALWSQIRITLYFFLWCSDCATWTKNMQQFWQPFSKAGYQIIRTVSIYSRTTFQLTNQGYMSPHLFLALKLPAFFPHLQRYSDRLSPQWSQGNLIGCRSQSLMTGTSSPFSSNPSNSTDNQSQANNVAVSIDHQTRQSFDPAVIRQLFLEI